MKYDSLILIILDLEDFVEKVKSGADENLWQEMPWDLYDNWHEKTWISFERISSLINHENVNLIAQWRIINMLEKLSRTADKEENPAPVDLNLEYVHDALRKYYSIVNDDEIEEEFGYLKTNISTLVNILGYCTNSKSLEALLLFVRPKVLELENKNEEWLEENRTTEFALKSIRIIIQQSSDLHHDSYDGLKISIAQEDKEMVMQSMIEGRLKESVTELECECGKISNAKFNFYGKTYQGSEERITCNSCNNEKELKRIHFCEDCSKKICDYCYKMSGVSHKREVAVEIMRLLNDKNVIEYILPFINSENPREVKKVLETLFDHNDPRLNDYLVEIISDLDLSKEKMAKINARNKGYLCKKAIKMLGERGDEEHLDMLLDKLRIFSKSNSVWGRKYRDAIEDALVNLHEHSKDHIFKILHSEDNLGIGFENSLKRILNKIKDKRKSRSDDNWIHELYGWRTEEFEKSDYFQEYMILNQDKLISIYYRQPETYEELMDHEIGANKVNKYGQDILNIVRKNSPDIPADEKEIGPWKLPLGIEELLKSELVKINHEDTESVDADYLSNIGANTKISIKKMIREKFPYDDEVILWKVLDCVIKDMEQKGSLIKGGKGRGIRYVIIS